MIKRFWMMATVASLASSFIIGAVSLNRSVAYQQDRLSAETIKNRVIHDLNQEKQRGNDWIHSQSDNKEVYALVTFNQRQTLDQALEIAKKNNLQVMGWNDMINMGGDTGVGGYLMGKKESLTDAKKRYLHMSRQMLKNFLAQLDQAEDNKRYPAYLRKSATLQKEELKKYLQSFSSKQPVIYGIKVKGKAADLKLLLNGQVIVAVKESSLNDESSAPYRKIG